MSALRLALIDAGLIACAIVGALIVGMATGPLLGAGNADPAAFILPVAIATVPVTGFGAWRRTGHRRWMLAGWTILGATSAVLLLVSVASARWPADGTHAPPDMPRLPLALFTPLDLDQAGRGIGPELAARFVVERLDTLTAESLEGTQRLLMAQPRLMTPEELVHFDAWVRRGGTALILADPLLLWADGLPLGDRRRPPITSLLDPLLTHWGLELVPATSSAIERRFVGQHLVRLAGASRFLARPVPDARCNVEADGWMALCAVGRGHVRLIADADLIDARLWLAGEGTDIASDAVLLIDHWLRAPQVAVPGGASSLWVRSEATLRNGVRIALGFAILWAMAGGALLWLWDRPGKIGFKRDPQKNVRFGKEQL